MISTAPGALASGGRGPASRSSLALLVLAMSCRQAQSWRGRVLKVLRGCKQQSRKSRGYDLDRAWLSSPAGAADRQAGLRWPSLLWRCTRQAAVGARRMGREGIGFCGAALSSFAKTGRRRRRRGRRRQSQPRLARSPAGAADRQAGLCWPSLFWQ
jgi:hypothetical protein